MIRGEDGPLYQLTFSGDNTEVAYSSLFNKILYTKKINSTSAQIYELDLTSNKEKRITYNLGENRHSSFHPFKPWITYSSSKDEAIEKLPVQKLMNEYGLENSPLMENEKGHEVYISTQDGSDIQRITKQKGFDGHPIFNSDGDRILYLRYANSKYEIASLDPRNQNTKVIVSQSQPIVDFHANSDYIAVLSLIADNKVDLKVFSLKKPKEVLFELSTAVDLTSVFVHKSTGELLVSGTFKDDQNIDIYKIDWKNNCSIRVTSEKNQDVGPVFGGDTNTVLFSSNRAGTYQIYTLKIPPNTTCVKF